MQTDGKPRPRRRWLLLSGGLIAVSATVVVLSGWMPFRFLAANEQSATASGKPAAEIPAPPSATHPPVPVKFAVVTTRPIERRLSLVGTLTGQEEFDLAGQNDGRIVRIHHDVGDTVKGGDLLLELDDTDDRLARDQVVRGLEMALAKLGLTELPGTDFDIEALPAVLRSKLVEENARRTLERTQQLIRQKVTTQDELERVETNHRVAIADVDAQRIIAREALAAVKQAAVQLAIAEKKLADDKVTAPRLSCLIEPAVARQTGLLPTLIEGSAASSAAVLPCDMQMTIGERYVSEGERVVGKGSTKLFRLIVEHPLKLQAKVVERYVGQVRVGQPVQVHVEAFPDETFTGTVGRVSPLVDRVSRSFEIEVTVPNPDRRLKAGSFTSASLLLDRVDEATVVPEEAVVRYAGVRKVFVIDGDHVREVPVETGMLIDSRGKEGGANTPLLQVRGKLFPGDRVVVSGQTQLADQSAIRIREADPEKGAASHSAEPAVIHEQAVPSIKEGDRS